MRIHECSICSYPMYPGHGMTFVRNDAKVFRFCSRKCRMLFNRKTNPRRLRWTKSYRKEHNKELALDTTFDFEKQRNRPPKYDRELYAQTIKAMKRVTQIQFRRQRTYYFKRMRESLKRKKMLINRELKYNKELVIAPVAERKRLQMEVEEQQTDAARDLAKLQNKTPPSIIKHNSTPSKQKKVHFDQNDIVFDENNDINN